jgi:hypothetical protein
VHGQDLFIDGNIGSTMFQAMPAPSTTNDMPYLRQEAADLSQSSEQGVGAALLYRFIYKDIL